MMILEKYADSWHLLWKNKPSMLKIIKTDEGQIREKLTNIYLLITIAQKLNLYSLLSS